MLKYWSLDPEKYDAIRTKSLIFLLSFMKNIKNKKLKEKSIYKNPEGNRCEHTSINIRAEHIQIIEIVSII